MPQLPRALLRQAGRGADHQSVISIWFQSTLPSPHELHREEASTKKIADHLHLRTGAYHLWLFPSLHPQGAERPARVLDLQTFPDRPGHPHMLSPANSHCQQRPPFDSLLHHLTFTLSVQGPRRVEKRHQHEHPARHSRTRKWEIHTRVEHRRD